MKLFTETELKVILLAVSAVTVVALVITVSVGLARRSKASRESISLYDRDTELIDSTDMIVPEEFTLIGGERWYFSREPMKKWNDDLINRFWIDPVEIGIELVREDTNRTMQELVEDIP